MWRFDINVWDSYILVFLASLPTDFFLVWNLIASCECIQFLLFENYLYIGICLFYFSSMLRKYMNALLYLRVVGGSCCGSKMESGILFIFIFVKVE